MRDLSVIVKANDVRGVVPDQFDEPTARALGAGFARHVADLDGATRAVVGHDMRTSSPVLAEAVAAGIRDQGLDVVAIGLASTDLLYFASGRLDLPGVMLTASHNPARYNGLKLCRAGAVPLGLASGLGEIRRLAEAGLSTAPDRGGFERRDVLPDYAAYLRGLVDLAGIPPLTVVVDAANGMAGHTVPPVLEGLPVRLVPLYFELDGSFPNHPADPLDPANLVDLSRAVVEHGADLGLAFDGDADRCFVVDEAGSPVSTAAIAGLVATRELAKNPGASVIYNLICSRALPQIVAEHGGTAVRSRVGHAFIKAEMARTGAIFGAELSAHYYFRDFWWADTGMLAALHVLAALGEAQLPMSKLASEFVRYATSGEINSTVDDPAATIAEIERVFAARPEARFDHLDGLTVDLPGARWFNVRPSNTEPLLRLNVEAPDVSAMSALRDEVLALIRRGAER